MSENVPSDIYAQQRFRSACAQWSESSLGEIWIAKDAKFLHADNEDSNPTARIWAFVGRTCQKAIFWHLPAYLPAYLPRHMYK